MEVGGYAHNYKGFVKNLQTQSLLIMVEQRQLGYSCEPHEKLSPLFSLIMMMTYIMWPIDNMHI